VKVTAAIWVLAYNIARTDRLRYLEWFHHDHVAEKLARPGYQWAAHFEGETHGSATGASGYLALFGGDTTAIFLNPSPAQLKTRQDHVTREMIGLRQSSRMAILVSEWTVPDAFQTPNRHSHIELLVLDSTRGDEAIGAWAVQQLAQKLVVVDKTGSLIKLASVTGAPHHYAFYSSNRLVEQFVSNAAENLVENHTCISVATSWAGRRIWPA
jgi:hypothetical protein